MSRLTELQEKYPIEFDPFPTREYGWDGRERRFTFRPYWNHLFFPRAGFVQEWDPYQAAHLLGTLSIVHEDPENPQLGEDSTEEEWDEDFDDA